MNMKIDFQKTDISDAATLIEICNSCRELEEGIFEIGCSEMDGGVKVYRFVLERDYGNKNV